MGLEGDSREFAEAAYSLRYKSVTRCFGYDEAILTE